MNLVASLAEIVQKVDVFVPIQETIPQNPYFGIKEGFYKEEREYSFVNHLAPLLNSIYTPLSLKDVKVDHYFNQIVPNHRNIFSCCYTLPYLNEKSSEKEEEGED